MHCARAGRPAAGIAWRRSCAKRAFRPRRYTKFKATADSRHRHSVADNLLTQDFNVSQINQWWIAHISYIPTEEGWLYLAVMFDLYSRAIVGWALDKRMTAQLVVDVLTMALWRRGSVKGLPLHSDRGCQYAAGDCQQLLQDRSSVGDTCCQATITSGEATSPLCGKTTLTSIVNIRHLDDRRLV